MKNLLCAGIAFTAIGLMNVSFANELKPTLVPQEPEHVFTPLGFDSNDNSQVVLYGTLPNTCYKVGPIRYRVDQKKKAVFVQSTAYHYPGHWCAEVMVPYQQVVNLGILKEGNYDISVASRDGSYQNMGKLPVSTATSTKPDENLYAPVEQVFLRKGDGGASSEVVVSGVFRNTCMQLKELQVTYRPNRVIEVLPLAQIRRTNCAPEMRPFTATAVLSGLAKGKALIHVRSLNGQALNQVSDL